MKKTGYYSSGEFARMAGVTLRTIRYYDKQDILKPSLVTDKGTRFYTDEDFARLQQILLLKYLGFSLEDIHGLTIADVDYHFMLESLKIQRKLIQDRIEQMQLMESTIKDTIEAIQSDHSVEWSKMLELIHLTGMEKSLKNQYQNASNISARINLHQLFSENKEGWFPWIFRKCELKSGMTVLELGCGDGTLWKVNAKNIPENVSITLSDISEGMLRDARRTLGEKVKLNYEVFDCHRIPYEDEMFDLVIANHVFFYCENLEQVCEEVKRILKPNGRLICSTYGKEHMKEIGELICGYDERIVLSAEKLYEFFGRENGSVILEKYFSHVKWEQYEDRLFVPEPEPLIAYVLSCHGNQGQYIMDRYADFRAYVKRKVEKGLVVSKDAGVFICEKN